MCPVTRRRKNNLLPASFGKEKRRQRGVTLIEVLVAVLVLSIGLIGLAALQVAALQANQISYQRSQATNLAYDVIERMRANRQAALNGNYDTPFQDPPECEDPSDGGSLAQTDLNQWHMALSCSLSGGQGQITTNANNIVGVTIRWRDRDDDDSEATESFTTRTEL